MATNKTSGWYTLVSYGGALVTAYPTDWPRGLWPSEEEAMAALERWRERKGALAGKIEAAHNIRVVGPFPTREIARLIDAVPEMLDALQLFVTWEDWIDDPDWLALVEYARSTIAKATGGEDAE